MTAPDHDRPPRRRGRALRATGSATVVLAVGAAAAATFGFGGGDPAPAANDLPPATAQVTRQTLLDTESLDGELGYGPTTTLSARLTGTVTALPASGAVIARGQSLYKVDNAPIVLLYGSVPAYRSLGPGDEGVDVRQLEQNLKALGYTGFTVDDEYSSSTASAVEEWQDDLGLPETGRIELGRIVFAPAAVRVDSVSAGLAAPSQPGQAVLAYTGTARLVTVRLEVSDRRLARIGAKVDVELPDGTRVAGRVERVDTVIEQGSAPEATPETKLDAIVSLADAKAGTDLDTAAVEVLFTAAERKDVLTVPVSALLALAEGGYGLEVVDGPASHYIRVETGLFANGRVEVSGAGLTEGMTVGLPR